MHCSDETQGVVPPYIVVFAFAMFSLRIVPTDQDVFPVQVGLPRIAFSPVETCRECLLRELGSKSPSTEMKVALSESVARTSSSPVQCEGIETSPSLSWHDRLVLSGSWERGERTDPLMLLHMPP